MSEHATIVHAVQSLCDSNAVPVERMSAVSYAVEDITTVVKKCFPEAEVQCYGSMVTGMMGRNSDVSAHFPPRRRPILTTADRDILARSISVSN